MDSVLLTGEINIRDNLTTNRIEALLGHLADRIRQVAPEVKNVYLEPHPVPQGTREAHRASIGERVGT